MIECGATFSAEVSYIYHKPRSNCPEVCIYLYQLTPLTTNRRPIRKGAPEYNGSRRRSPEEIPPTPNGVPTFRTFETEPVGFRTKIKRSFLE